MSRRSAAETRDAILDVARDLFEVGGYFSVGLEAVAKKAGVSRQAIYLHFDSKAALVEALHERINRLDVEPVMRHVWEQTDANAALDSFVTASAQAIPKIIAIANALESPRRVDPDIQAAWEVPLRGRYEDCRRLAEWLKRDGVLAPGITVRDTADVLSAMVSIHSYETLVVERGWTPQRWTRWQLKSLRRLLFATGQSPTRQRGHRRHDEAHHGSGPPGIAPLKTRGAP